MVVRAAEPIGIRKKTGKKMGFLRGLNGFVDIKNECCGRQNKAKGIMMCL